MGHSIITLRMIRRDVTFVAPEKPDFRPIQLTLERRVREHRIEAFRGRAPGKSERKGIPRIDGLPCVVKKVARRGFQQRVGRRVDVYVALRRRHARRQEGQSMALRSAAGIT